MQFNGEWWRTVRFAIKEEGRTGRLVLVLVVAGIIVGTLIMLGHGFTVSVG
ncbi:hypothetical protein ABT160_04465 [Streptomyces sp. NPDC001941]|uniref:hypothetical protein n=1 Tax=Streptomyces sp. NPDC001941 TaxID=3154659 RepID=UPI0033229BE1